jgi:hypothetical protein
MPHGRGDGAASDENRATWLLDVWNFQKPMCNVFCHAQACFCTLSPSQTLRAVKSTLRVLALSGNAFIADRVLAAVVRALTASSAGDSSSSDAAERADGGFPRLEVLRMSHMHAAPLVASTAAPLVASTAAAAAAADATPAVGMCRFECFYHCAQSCAFQLCTDLPILLFALMISLVRSFT